MLRKYITIVCFFLGIIAGMVQHQLTIPVISYGENAVYHGIRGKNRIALTVNVDWGEEFLPGMLRILHEKGVKCTFFITGNWAEKYPDLVREIIRLGHEIGNHGYRHLHPANLSNEELIELIKKNEELILNISNGYQTTLFAPPYGEVDKRIVKVAAELGYVTIMWSADTVDWQRPAPEIIVQRAISKIDDGGIILMHPTEPSLYALSDIIETLQKRDYSFVTVSELIENK